jgi:hypothetical protein
MPFQKVEFTFPDEEEEDAALEVEPSSAEPITPGKRAKAEAEDPDLEIEVVDDTPKADRGRKASDPPEDVTDEELAEYSDKVRKRIKHFSKGYHDERRAKEAAMREKQELERLAQQLVEENKRLKGTVGKNQTALLEQAKRNASAELEQAKKAYKDAYEAGDSDAVVAAQEQLTTAKIKVDKIANLKVPSLQENETPVKMDPETAPASKADPKAEAWRAANPWFGPDDEMTSFALGLHTKLVKQGVSPQSDAYYEHINARMRQVFPDQFEEIDEPEPVKPKRAKAQVVAPATRSVAPKKVVLTQTQVQIAKKLNVPLEEYARQVALEMRKTNG